MSSTAWKEKEQAEEQFLSQLLPHRKENLEDASKIPVEIWRGLLPGLHRNPEASWQVAEFLSLCVTVEMRASCT